MITNNNKAQQGLLICLLAILCGTLSGLAFVPWRLAPLWPLMLFLLVLLLWPQLQGNPTDRSAPSAPNRRPSSIIIKKTTAFFFSAPLSSLGFRAFLFYFAQNITTLSWAGDAPSVFDDSLAPFGYVIAIGLPALMSIYYVRAFLLARRQPTSARTLLVLAIGLSLAAFIHSFFLSGFPWNIASHGFVYLPFFMTLLPYVGQFVLSTWFYSSVCLLVWLFIIFISSFYGAMQPHLPAAIDHGLRDIFRPIVPKMNTMGRVTLYIASLLFITLPFFFGILRYMQLPMHNAFNKTAPAFLLVQPNISIKQEKKEPVYKQVLLLLAQSRQGLEKNAEKNKTRANIILWPESSVAAHFLDDIHSRHYITRFLNDREYLLLGTLRENELNTSHNSMVLMDNQGQVVNFYDKHHLVPLGEYIPFGRYLPFVPIAARDIDISTGPAPFAFPIGNRFAFIPLICYESAFPHLANRYQLERASNRALGAIVVITNDAWFGKTIGPEQHLFMSQLRAAENGLPLLRVGLTGITAIIDPYGRLLASLPFNTAGSIYTVPPAPLAVMPPYARFQKMIDFGLAFMLLTVLSITCWPQRQLWIKNKKARQKKQ
ncbi:MAG: apolipoprotein N-acyltransferase [Alphaproteobacteria bacterium]|nr:apolipoprotein N-acyltransferase [Alphaproteobacteria bacterium]